MNDRQHDVPSFFRPFFELDAVRPYLFLIGLQIAYTFLGTLLITSSSLA